MCLVLGSMEEVTVALLPRFNLLVIFLHCHRMANYKIQLSLLVMTHARSGMWLQPPQDSKTLFSKMPEVHGLSLTYGLCPACVDICDSCWLWVIEHSVCICSLWLLNSCLLISHNSQ